MKEMGISDHLTCLLRNLYAGQKQQLELDMEQRLVPNRKRSTSWLYIVTLLILTHYKINFFFNFLAMRVMYIFTLLI